MVFEVGATFVNPETDYGRGYRDGFTRSQDEARAINVAPKFNEHGCSRCWETWSAAKNAHKAWIHGSQKEGGSYIECLCEKCWSELESSEHRLPYYRAYIDWLSQWDNIQRKESDKAENFWADIRSAVIREDERLPALMGDISPPERMIENPDTNRVTVTLPLASYVRGGPSNVTVVTTCDGASIALAASLGTNDVILDQGMKWMELCKDAVASLKKSAEQTKTYSDWLDDCLSNRVVIKKAGYEFGVEDAIREVVMVTAELKLQQQLGGTNWDVTTMSNIVKERLKK